MRASRPFKFILRVIVIFRKLRKHERRNSEVIILEVWFYMSPRLSPRRAKY